MVCRERHRSNCLLVGPPLSARKPVLYVPSDMKTQNRYTGGIVPSTERHMVKSQAFMQGVPSLLPEPPCNPL